VNLASPETLQRLGSLLEGRHGSLALTERGEVDEIRRHPNFRLFAAMNPPTGGHGVYIVKISFNAMLQMLVNVICLQPFEAGSLSCTWTK
jgi:midasin (ATPase involved in ribosome maturation)